MELLNTMEHLSSIENRPLVAPNTVTYSCVIQALAKSRRAGSALQAQEVLERLLASNYIQSDVVVFTNVIDAWTRDSSQHGAKRALDLLMELRRQGRTTQCQDVYSRLSGLGQAWGISSDRKAAKETFGYSRNNLLDMCRLPFDIARHSAHDTHYG
jgi:hypothetical protein